MDRNKLLNKDAENIKIREILIEMCEQLKMHIELNEISIARRFSEEITEILRAKMALENAEETLRDLKFCFEIY